MGSVVVGGVVEADVDVLDGYSALGGVLARDRGIDAADLRTAIAAVRRATSDVPITIGPVDDRLALVAHEWAEVDDDVGRVARALRRADGGDPIAAMVLTVVLGAIEAERRHDDNPWDLDPARVGAGVEEVRRILDRDGGDGDERLDEIEGVFADLTGPEADAVLVQLTDDELRQLYDGRSPDGLRGLEVMLGEKVSLDTWRRLARFSPDIDPDPSRAGADLAAGQGPGDDYYRSLRYAPVAGDLVRPFDGETPFGFGDSAQGKVGDCYLLAAMQGLARQDPDALARLFSVNANGTVTVTFADGSKTVVSTDMPTEEDGTTLAFARNREGSGADLWPLVLEKAYAQRYGGWGAIGGGGKPTEVVTRLTGRPGSYVPQSATSVDDLAERLDDGEVLTLSTIPVPAGQAPNEWIGADAPDPFRRAVPNNVVPQHAFVVTAVDPVAGTVTAANPWDPTVRTITLSEKELHSCLQGIYVNAAP